MPILAIDQNGKVYVTSPDREDGSGYGHRPPKAKSGSDGTLGNAYKQAGKEWAQSVINQRKSTIADMQRQNREHGIRQVKALQARKEQALREKLAGDPQYQDALIRRAAAMGCDCTSIPSTELSGNGLTANGKTGYAGMDRDQQIIHNKYYGLGDASRRPSRDEATNRHMNQALLERAILQERDAKAARAHAQAVAPKQRTMQSRPAMRPPSQYAQAIKKGHY